MTLPAAAFHHRPRPPARTAAVRPRSPTSPSPRPSRVPDTVSTAYQAESVFLLEGAEDYGIIHSRLRSSYESES